MSESSLILPHVIPVCEFKYSNPSCSDFVASSNRTSSPALLNIDEVSVTEAKLFLGIKRVNFFGDDPVFSASSINQSVNVTLKSLSLYNSTHSGLSGAGAVITSEMYICWNDAGAEVIELSGDEGEGFGVVDGGMVSVGVTTQDKPDVLNKPKFDTPLVQSPFASGDLKKLIPEPGLVL